MFSKFSASSGPTPSSSSPTATITTPTGRITKRKHVSRACDWCRLNRIKCDDREPCDNCKARGAACSNNRSDELRTLPAANRHASSSFITPNLLTLDPREIERLRIRVRELETELATSKSCGSEHLPSSDQRSRNGASSSSIASHVASQAHQPACQPSRNGAWLLGPSGTDSHYHGQSSSALFAHRVQVQLADALGSSPLDHFQLSRTSKNHQTPASLSPASMSSTVDERCAVNGTMSRQQEECYLSLFWQSHHLQVPILDSETFKSLYDSLWDLNMLSRRLSALVDIVLALCIQCSATFNAQSAVPPTHSADDASSAGIWWYQRAQMALVQEYESPRLVTVQASILSVLYLLNAALPNTAHAVLSTAISISRTLGLHQSSPVSDTTVAQAERRLLWRCLSVLDNEISLDLGRQYLITDLNLSFTESPGSIVRLPQDQNMSFDAISLTDHFDLCVKLSSTLRSVRDRFDEMYSSSQGVGATTDDAVDPRQAMERSAVLLLQLSKDVKQWTQNVPALLQLSKKGGSSPFSTSRTPLEFDSYVPLWLQRQRVLLELFYHRQMMLLYRPFVLFPHSSASIPICAGHGASCMGHASTIATIINQVLVESDVFNVLHAVYQLQWDALISLAAFALAHPLCPHAVTARTAMETSVATLKLLAAKNSLGIMTDAAGTAQRLLDQVNSVAQTYRNGSVRTAGPMENRTPSSSASTSHLTSPHPTNNPSVSYPSAPVHSTAFDIHSQVAPAPPLNGTLGPSTAMSSEHMSGLVPGNFSMHDPMSVASLYDAWPDMLMDST